MEILILFALMFFVIAIGVPIGFAIAAATAVVLYFFTNLDMVILAQYAYSGINSFPIMAIPFFMLAGIIMSTGGIAKRIVNFCFSLVGVFTGGLGAVSILASMFFAAISGSGMATVSSIGGMMIPEMKKHGYDVPYSTALVCFAGTIGPIIPPSISFIMFGVVTNTSIADLFLAGILPGIMMGLALMTVNYYLCRKKGMGQRQVSTESLSPGDMMRRTLQNVWKSFREGFWALLSPVIILGGIYSGIFTPTEAACVSVVYSTIVSMFVYKEMTPKMLYKALLAAVILNGATSFLLGFSTVFSTYLSFAQIPQLVYEVLMSLTSTKVIMLLLVNITLLLLGCVLDTVPAVVVMAPILLPAAVGFGVNPVHFGVIMAVNLAIGLCTPPYGCNLFVGAAVAGIKMEQMFRYIFPMLFVLVACLLVITFVPQLSLFFL